MKFGFESVIKHLPAYDDPQPYETFKGTVEAESHDKAKKQAQSLVFERCQQLMRERGSIYGYDPNNVRINESDPT